MSATLTGGTMPKQKSTQDGGDTPAKTTTKMSVDLLRKAKMVSLHRGIDLFDYLEAIVLPVVNRDYDEMIQKEARAPKRKGGENN